MKKPEADSFNGNILIVDDDVDVLLSAELILKKRQYSVQCLSNPAELEAVLKAKLIQVVILDMNFTRGYTAGAEGIYWLGKVKSLSPDTRVIMATAFSEIELAIEAIKQGASEFLVKPWDNDRLVQMVEACIGKSNLPSTLLANKSTPAEDTSILGSNLNLEQIEKIAIEKAINQYEGNMTQIAKALGLGRTTLYRKMSKYGLSS